MASHSRRAEINPQTQQSEPQAAADAADEMEHTPLPGSRIDELLERVAQPTLPAIERPSTVPASPVASPLRTARVTRVLDNRVELRMRGSDQTVIALIDESVERDLLVQAQENGGTVLVETLSGQDPVVIGLLQTRLPSKMELKARDIVIDAEREVLIRAGRAALRIREDGDVELVGSRILTMSRGLFRIVGRVLRLN